MPMAVAAPPRLVSTVLVVEDDALTRFATATYLADCGWRVLQAASAGEARAILDADSEIDLVFSDVEMPRGLDGIALAHWVHARHPGVRMMLTSGVASLAGVPAEICAPSSTFRKPYQCEAIAERIHALLGRD
jgi:DNA-binding NtrC family response regulator